MTKKTKEHTTTITLTMSQYNELEGVISFAHFNGYYDRLRKECNWDGYPETRSKDLKDYQDLYGIINNAGDDFDYRWC